MDRALICDYSNLIMANAYFVSGSADEKAYFDIYFRQIPDGGGYIIFAGLESAAEFINTLKFSDEELEFLKSTGEFDLGFIEYLKNFHFTGDLYSVAEGTPVFPNEPLITVFAPIIEMMILETYLLLCVNHQSSVATRASRIVRAADGRRVIDFSSRKSQGAHAANNAARAAYIGGFDATTCTMAVKNAGIPAAHPMSHSWVQSFDSEYEAFEAYCRLSPSAPEFLIDTSDVRKSGLPNAIRAIKQHYSKTGEGCSVRIDSGDITYLSKKIRQQLDEEGLKDCKITASNRLDEYIIRELCLQGAQVDAFIIGERLVNSSVVPGCVCKMVALEKNGEIIPKIKRSENASKITNPHYKKPYRLFDSESGMAIADYICVYDEKPSKEKELVIFDPDFTWKQKTLTEFKAEELHKQIFKNGKFIYSLPDVKEAREYSAKQLGFFWDEVKRFENPHNYYVDLSGKLWNIKNALLKKL